MKQGDPDDGLCAHCWEPEFEHCTFEPMNTTPPLKTKQAQGEMRAVGDGGSNDPTGPAPKRDRSMSKSEIMFMGVLAASVVICEIVVQTLGYPDGPITNPGHKRYFLLGVFVGVQALAAFGLLLGAIVMGIRVRERHVRAMQPKEAVDV